MIRTFALLNLFCLVSIAAAQTNGLRIDGPLTFEEPVITVPATVEDTSAVATFRFRNAGTKKVYVANITPMCGCTTAELEKRVYEPGEGGSLTVLFDFGNLIGPQRKRIVLASQVEGENRVEQDIAIACDIPGILVFEGDGSFVWVVGRDVGPKTAHAKLAKPGFGKVVDIVQPNNKAFTSKLIPGPVEGEFTIEMTPTTLAVDKPTSGMGEVLIDVGNGRIRKQPIWGMIIPKEAK